MFFKVRPKTAPSKSNDFVLDGIAVTTQNRYKPTADRYVLLKDKGDIDEDELKRQRSVSPIRASTKQGVKLRKSVPSSAYGKVTPSKPGLFRSLLLAVVLTRMISAPKESFDASPSPTPSFHKSPMNKNVSSSGYGKVNPVQAPKPTPKASEPLWSPSKKAPAILPLPTDAIPKKYTDIPATGSRVTDACNFILICAPKATERYPRPSHRAARCTLRLSGRRRAQSPACLSRRSSARTFTTTSARRATAA